MGRRKTNEIGIGVAVVDAEGTSGPRDFYDVEATDAELLRRHVAGDSDAFSRLFLRHRDRLWAVALRTACDPEDAADALQEAMISAFRRAADFRGESAVTTWLHRIVVNAAVDRLRRRPGRNPYGQGAEAGPDSQTADGPHMLPYSVESAELRLDVDAALRKLPHQQRTALVLVDMLGYPVADVSEMLGVSVGTVKSRCARGRARLLPYLSHLRTNSRIGGNQQAAVGVSSGQEGDA
ncbi:MAG: polymerase sigma factor SigM [Actinomycetia bacterium]|nr:polymerase sigma factor SigM [Actinomycetes bacterium]